MVCSSTPVALTTSVSRARAVASDSSRARREASAGSPVAVASATAVRAASTSRGWGSPVSASDRASRSMLGGLSLGESEGRAMRSRG